MKLNKKMIIIATLLAAVTTIGIYSYIQSIQAAVNNMDFVEVWVAKNNIPSKTKIDGSMIKVEKIAEKYVLKNAITDKQQISGKYAMERIMEGEQILSDHLVELDKIHFSYQIPKGKRAITIKVDEVSGVADLIKPGDYVDVLVFAPEKEIEEKTTKAIYPDITKVMLQNLLVLSVDQEQGEMEKKEVKVKSEEIERKITLAASTADVEKLVLGDEIGKIHLALRHPEEKTTNDTLGAIREDIVPNKGKRTTTK